MGDGTPSSVHRFDKSIETYLEMSNVLRNDVLDSLATESPTLHWRRNHIRLIASVIEAHIHCIRHICWAIEFDAGSLSKKESKVFYDKKDSAVNRFKNTIRMAYKIFDLHPCPDFSGPEWNKVKLLINIRNSITHPKNVADLQIAEKNWVEVQDSISWMLEQLFNFPSALRLRYK